MGIRRAESKSLDSFWFNLVHVRRKMLLVLSLALAVSRLSAPRRWRKEREKSLSFVGVSKKEFERLVLVLIFKLFGIWGLLFYFVPFLWLFVLSFVFLASTSGCLLSADTPSTSPALPCLCFLAA